MGFLAPAHHHQKEDEGEAEAGESRASAAPSLARPRAGALAGERVEGTLNYYAVPGNIDLITAFRDQIRWHWIQTLRRRSQRHRMTWERYSRIEKKWLPLPASCILPQRALRRQDPRQEPGALIPHAGICPGGRP